jgi:hypothetical protein
MVIDRIKARTFKRKKICCEAILELVNPGNKEENCYSAKRIKFKAYNSPIQQATEADAKFYFVISSRIRRVKYFRHFRGHNQVVYIPMDLWRKTCKKELKNIP